MKNNLFTSEIIDLYVILIFMSQTTGQIIEAYLFQQLEIYARFDEGELLLK